MNDFLFVCTSCTSKHPCLRNISTEFRYVSLLWSAYAICLHQKIHRTGKVGADPCAGLILLFHRDSGTMMQSKTQFICFKMHLPNLGMWKMSGTSLFSSIRVVGARSKNAETP